MGDEDRQTSSIDTRLTRPTRLAASRTHLGHCEEGGVELLALLVGRLGIRHTRPDGSASLIMVVEPRPGLAFRVSLALG